MNKNLIQMINIIFLKETVLKEMKLKNVYCMKN